MANEDFEMDRDGDVARFRAEMSLRDLRVSYGEREILHGITSTCCAARRW